MRLKGCRRSVLQKSYDLTTSLRNVTGLDRPKDQQRVSQCQFTTFSHGQMETNARLTSSTDSGARIMSLRSLDVWPAGESFSQASAGCKGQKRPDERKGGRNEEAKRTDKTWQTTRSLAVFEPLQLTLVDGWKGHPSRQSDTSASSQPRRRMKTYFLPCSRGPTSSPGTPDS